MWEVNSVVTSMTLATLVFKSRMVCCIFCIDVSMDKIFCTSSAEGAGEAEGA